jgi:hypothetical protein
MLIVVPIPRIQAFEHRELAHLALTQLGAPDAAVPEVLERDRDGRLLAGAHSAPLELVGAVERAIPRTRRLLQLRERIVEIILAEIAEGGDHATHQEPDQIEHRIADPEDAGAALVAVALGVAHARLRGVVVRVPLGADASLVE